MFDDMYDKREGKIISALINQNDFLQNSKKLHEFIEDLFISCVREDERENLRSRYEELFGEYLVVMQKFMYSKGAEDIMSLMFNMNVLKKQDIKIESLENFKSNPID